MSRKLDDWVTSYLAYTANTEPKESYRKWMAISAIAAALRRKCYLPWGIETFYPNVFVILVGPPAARKGTAMKHMMDLIDTIGLPRAADEYSRQKLIKKLSESSFPDTNPETGAIYVHSSLTIFATELTVFLHYGDKDLLTTLCKLFDCESRFQYDTIGRGLDDITNVWLSLIGATTPVSLQTSLPPEAFGSGFVSRTIFVFEENKEKVIIYPGLTDEQKLIKEYLISDLERISALQGGFKMEDAALEIYADWRYNAEAHPPFADVKLSGYVDRRPIHIFKLCMIFSASRSNEMIIRKEDINRAIITLHEVEKKMPYAFRGIGQNPLAEVQVRIMRTIAEAGEISSGSLMEMFFNDVSREELTSIIAALEMIGFCKLDIKEKKIKYKK